MAGKFDDAMNKYQQLRRFPMQNIGLMIDDHMTNIFIEMQQSLKALEVLEARMTQDHADIRSSDEAQSMSCIVLYQNAAKCYSADKQYTRAAALFGEVERAAITLGPIARARLPGIYSDMALNFKRAGQFLQAKDSYKLAVRNLDQVSRGVQRTILLNYAALLRDVGETAEADRVEKKAGRPY